MIEEPRRRRLEGMLRAAKNRLVQRAAEELGGRVPEGDVERLLETVEIGDRATVTHTEDLELGVLELRRKELAQIDRALSRLREGRYGDCQDCEEPIEEERLEALPFATRCVECERQTEADHGRAVPTASGFRSGFDDLHSDGDEE